VRDPRQRYRYAARPASRIEDGKEIARDHHRGHPSMAAAISGADQSTGFYRRRSARRCRQLRKLGYVQIKIYSSVKPELVSAIIDEAHKKGCESAGHIPAEMTAAQCVKARV